MSPVALADSLYLNDRSMAVYGLNIPTPGSWASGPAQSDRLTSVPGFAGSALTAEESSIGTRTLQLSGTFMPVSTAEGKTLWDEILRILGSGLLEVRFADYPDRVGYARYRGVTWDDITTWNIGAPVSLTVEMPNPYKIARSPDVYAIASGTQLPITLGSAPSDVTLQLIGTGAANPGVRYRDAQGMIRGELSFGLTLALEDWIDYDSAWMLGARYSYTPTIPATMIPATIVDTPELNLTRAFVLSPTDGDGTVGPTLEAVNADVVARVVKAWR